MKKKLFVIFTALMLAVSLSAVEIDLNLAVGGRTLKNDAIKDIYGTGTVIYPSIALNVWQGLTVGAAFEGGYDREGYIGIYNEKTTLEMSGLEFFVAWQFNLKRFRPYVRLGYGHYSYKQTVENGMNMDIDDSKGTVTLGAGVKIYLIKGLYVNGDVRLVDLKVRPYEEEINLGGWRYTLGVGYSFKL